MDKIRDENYLNRLSIKEIRELNTDSVGILTELDERKSAHFCYYTQLSTAEKILDNKHPHFRISPLSAMNDTEEYQQHTKDGNRVYALCFSHSDSESIPMWYLYSGIAGDGAKISVTPKKMKMFIENIKEVFPVQNGNVDRSHPLSLGKDFDLEYGWIYYLRKEKIKYRNHLRYIQTTDNLDALMVNNYFVKNYEWNYEKEFRIVFKLKENVMKTYPEKIALFFDKKKLLKDNALSVTLAPEFKDISRNGEIAEMLGIPLKQISNSKLGIHMNLIKRNQKSIVEHIDELVEQLSDEELRTIDGAVSSELEKTCEVVSVH